MNKRMESLTKEEFSDLFENSNFYLVSLDFISSKF